MAIAYSRPDFNLAMDRWFWPNTPFLGAADLVGIPCQHYVYSRLDSPITADWFRIPVDVANGWVESPLPVNDIFECPAGSGRYWRSWQMFWLHEGFPNEYWVITGVQTDATGAAGIGRHLP